MCHWTNAEGAIAGDLKPAEHELVGSVGLARRKLEGNIVGERERHRLCVAVEVNLWSSIIPTLSPITSATPRGRHR